jgi:Helix-turn-helix domain
MERTSYRRSQHFLRTHLIESKQLKRPNTPKTLDTRCIFESERDHYIMATAIHRIPTDSDTISNVHLSAVQIQVVTALAQGHSVTAAARQAGVHRDTIYHWLANQPEFETAVENARSEYAAVLSDGMRDLATRALETLHDLLDNPTTPAGVRLRTALAILQRPHLPEQGWRLPERIESPRQHQVPAVSSVAREAKAPQTAPIARRPCAVGQVDNLRAGCQPAQAGAGANPHP